jgi:hypothetical protein
MPADQLEQRKRVECRRGNVDFAKAPVADGDDYGNGIALAVADHCHVDIRPFGKQGQDALAPVPKSGCRRAARVSRAGFPPVRLY